MDLHRKTSLIVGIFFAFTFIFSIPALLFYDPLLNHVDYVVGAGADTRVAFGALFEIIVVISNIATAVVLFPILKRQNEAVSLGYVASRIVESTIIAVGIVSVIAVVTLRQDLAGVAGTDSGSLELAGRSLVAIHDATFLLGPAFCAGFGTGLLLGYLMYTSGLVPPRMALLGLIGGPIAFATATAVCSAPTTNNQGSICSSPFRRSSGSYRSPSGSSSKDSGRLRSSPATDPSRQFRCPSSDTPDARAGRSRASSAHIAYSRLATRRQPREPSGGEDECGDGPGAEDGEIDKAQADAVRGRVEGVVKSVGEVLER